MSSNGSNHRLSLAMMAAAVAAVLLSATRGVQGQTSKFCEGELGQADWACDTLSPVSPDVYDGDFLPLPGSPDPENPASYKQIAGDPAFDAATGERNSNAAVFVLTEGTYFCMVAESNGEAALFDAPEGNFVSSTTQYPTASWLPESVKALLGDGTKLKHIVYTHGHWDHIGAAGLVADYFAADGPLVISSRRTRWMLKHRVGRDPNTAFGNNRVVPLPVWYQKDVLSVGGLRFELGKAHVHQAGDYLIFLDKNVAENSAEGIATSIVMVADGVFPGWSPFFSLAITQDVLAYYDAMDEINGYDFDVFVGGHLSRLGTKEDVQIKVDYLADILAGVELALATVSLIDVFVGTGIGDPSNANVGNAWLNSNEYIDRIVDVCYDYVLDSSARGSDWLNILGGVEVTLRSHCFVVQAFVRVG